MITFVTEPVKLIYAPTAFCRFNAAYNPYVFTFTFDALPAGATSRKVNCRVQDKTGTTVETLEAYENSQQAILDVSRTVQRMIDRDSAYAEQTQYNDTSLYCRFGLYFWESYYDSGGTLVESAPETYGPYFAVRGTRQIPNSPNYFGNAIKNTCYSVQADAAYSAIGDFLTLHAFDRRLPVWNGYPRDVAVLITEFSESMRFMRNDGGVETFTALAQDGTYPGLVNRAGIASAPGYTYPWDTVYLKDGHGGGNYCSQIYTLVKKTVTKNPYYVRWLNPWGGFEYWCFDKRQTFSYTASDHKLLGRDITDFENARATHELYGGKGAKAVRLGATNLNEVEFLVLATLPFSPRVEVWEGGIWIGLQPEPATSETVSDKPAGEVEFTLIYPEIQRAY